MSILLLVIIGVSVSYAIGYNTGIRYEKNENTNQLQDFPDLVTLKLFLAENKIDENTWKDNEYTCYTFSTDLVEAARVEGYRAQVVVKSDYMGTGLSHARVQFWVDSIHAWVLVEPQDDGIIDIFTSYTKYGTWIG